MFLRKSCCGERGIRTPGTCYSTPDFESGTLNRSDISPVKWVSKINKILLSIDQVFI